MINFETIRSVLQNRNELAEFDKESRLTSWNRSYSHGGDSITRPLSEGWKEMPWPQVVLLHTSATRLVSGRVWKLGLRSSRAKLTRSESLFNPATSFILNLVPVVSRNYLRDDINPAYMSEKVTTNGEYVNKQGFIVLHSTYPARSQSEQKTWCPEKFRSDGI